MSPPFAENEEKLRWVLFSQATQIPFSILQRALTGSPAKLLTTVTVDPSRDLSETNPSGDPRETNASRDPREIKADPRETNPSDPRETKVDPRETKVDPSGDRRTVDGEDLNRLTLQDQQLQAVQQSYKESHGAATLLPVEENLSNPGLTTPVEDNLLTKGQSLSSKSKKVTVPWYLRRGKTNYRNFSVSIAGSDRCRSESAIDSEKFLRDRVRACVKFQDQDSVRDRLRASLLSEKFLNQDCVRSCLLSEDQDWVRGCLLSEDVRALASRISSELTKPDRISSELTKPDRKSMDFRTSMAMALNSDCFASREIDSRFQSYERYLALDFRYQALFEWITEILDSESGASAIPQSLVEAPVDIESGVEAPVDTGGVIDLAESTGSTEVSLSFANSREDAHNSVNYRTTLKYNKIISFSDLEDGVLMCDLLLKLLVVSRKIDPEMIEEEFTKVRRSTEEECTKVKRSTAFTKVFTNTKVAHMHCYSLHNVRLFHSLLKKYCSEEAEREVRFPLLAFRCPNFHKAALVGDALRNLKSIWESGNLVGKEKSKPDPEYDPVKTIDPESDPVKTIDHDPEFDATLPDFRGHYDPPPDFLGSAVVFGETPENQKSGKKKSGAMASSSLRMDVYLSLSMGVLRIFPDQIDYRNWKQEDSSKLSNSYTSTMPEHTLLEEIFLDSTARVSVVGDGLKKNILSIRLSYTGSLSSVPAFLPGVAQGNSETLRLGGTLSSGPGSDISYFGNAQCRELGGFTKIFRHHKKKVEQSVTNIFYEKRDAKKPSIRLQPDISDFGGCGRGGSSFNESCSLFGRFTNGFRIGNPILKPFVKTVRVYSDNDDATPHSSCDARSDWTNLVHHKSYVELRFEVNSSSEGDCDYSKALDSNTEAVELEELVSAHQSYFARIFGVNTEDSVLDQFNLRNTIPKIEFTKVLFFDNGGEQEFIGTTQCSL